MDQPRIVSRDEWLAERKQHLIKEKKLTRLRDQLSAERRSLPWVKVEKSYIFDGPDGKQSLADLFGGRSQLILQHFMFGPGWEEGCVGCSYGADHVDGARMHFEHRDVTFVAVSRAPLPKIEAFKQRMGWRFKWVSSFGSDFNYDYNVSFTPEVIAKGKVFYNFRMCDAQSEEMSGISVFYKDANGDLFHTYSTYGRGDELLSTMYMYLDLVPRAATRPVSHTRPPGSGTTTVTTTRRTARILVVAPRNRSLQMLLEHENAVNDGAGSVIGGELVRAFAREGALD